MIRKLYYTFLNAITLGRGVKRNINGMSIRFPARWSRYYESDYEEWNYHFLKQHVKPGMDIIDIGAHLGLFSVYCSKLSKGKGKIVCFEPTPGTFEVLKQTLRLNHVDNVEPIQAAISEHTGKATFYISETAGCNTNSLLKNSTDKDLDSYQVNLYTIDQVTKTHDLKPSLIKIDVEGAELGTLKGGLATFRQYSPVLILGLHPAFIKSNNNSLEEIWDLLQNSNYEVRFGEKKMTRESFCSQGNLFDVHCFRN